MRNMFGLFSCLFFLLAGGHASAQTPVERADSILQKLGDGVLPAATEKARYFSGPCTVLAGTVDGTQTYFAMLGVQKVAGTILTTWFVSYGGSEDPFAGRPYEARLRDAPLLYPAAPVGGQRLRTVIDAAPYTLGYEFSQDAGDADKIYLAGTHVGLTYCELSALDPR